MIGRPSTRLLASLASPALFLALCAAGCGGEEEGGHLVVGLTTDLAVGFDIRRVEATAKVDGVVAHAESRSYSKGKLSLPTEIELPPVRDGAEVEVVIAAFRDGETAPLVARTAATRAMIERTLLLPVSLDEACSAVACAGGATCVAGACVDPFIAPSSLAGYDPAWIATAPDACKTPLSGSPAIEIGQGSSAFAPLLDGEVVPIEAGPQGGHHVWIAVRATGLRQMGSHLMVEGNYPDLAFELLPFSSSITLRKAGEGHCEIYGVRFEVDRYIPVESVRGQALDLEVTLEDPNGDVASAMKRVVIAL